MVKSKLHVSLGRQSVPKLLSYEPNLFLEEAILLILASYGT